MKSDERDESEELTTDAANAAPADVTQDQPSGAEIETRPAGEEGALGNPEVEAAKERYLRLAAEFENFRKRTERERAECRDRAQAQLVEKLLEPLDDLQRVAQFSAEATTVEALLEGVRMVERKLVRLLEFAGLEALDAHGQPFDPELHDALMMAPTSDADEDDTVGEVFQPGYRFRGALLRPARVQVRRHAD